MSPTSGGASSLKPSHPTSHLSTEWPSCCPSRGPCSHMSASFFLFLILSLVALCSLWRSWLPNQGLNPSPSGGSTEGPPSPPGDSLSACFYLALCLGGSCLLLTPFSVFRHLPMHLSLQASLVSLSPYLSLLSLCCGLTPAALPSDREVLRGGSPVELNVQFPSLGVPSAPLCYSWEPDLLVTWELYLKYPVPPLGWQRVVGEAGSERTWGWR